MSGNNIIQKHKMGRLHSKRPKLDICVNPTLSCIKTNTLNSHDEIRTNLDSNVLEKKMAESVGAADDWDDEFSGEMLEEVCLIADISQAMVNNEIKPEESNSMSFHKGLKRTFSERDIDNNSELVQEIEKLRLENNLLRENIRTKEGEVQILRSRINQDREAVRNDMVNSMKIIEEIRITYNKQRDALRKEVEATKTELQFKDMELKSLTERTRQLEAVPSSTKLIEPRGVHFENKKFSFNVPQMPGKMRVKDNLVERNKYETKDEPLVLYVPSCRKHEGRILADLVCPSFFNFIEEPSVVPLYKFYKHYGFHMSNFDFTKREKYKWSGFPQQTKFIKDSYSLITELFLYENFSKKKAQDIITNVLEISIQILKTQRDSFLFLEKLQEKNREYDDTDYKILENMEQVHLINVTDILNAKKLNKGECGIESRRTLGLILALMISSESILSIMIENTDFATLLKNLVTSIGNLRRPMRYCGILAGIALIVSEFLRVTRLKKEFLNTLSKIIEEIIFARPKLDVFVHVIEALALGKNHVDFVRPLCRKAPIESYALYLSLKLQQILFVRKDACPLKLLCLQILGLSFIPVNRKIKWHVTKAIIKWINFMMGAPFSSDIKWLPNSCLTENEYPCFDVMECCVYLLNSCLNDLLLTSDFGKNDEEENEEFNFKMSVIGDGAVLLHVILKREPQLLYESYNLRFAALLRCLKLDKALRVHEKEAINWIKELLEMGFKRQEVFIKEDILKCLGGCMINALKIKDDSL